MICRPNISVDNAICNVLGPYSIISLCIPRDRGRIKVLEGPEVDLAKCCLYT
jgi:hypothetical protein